MANFLSPEWWDQAGKDIDNFFAGDNAVESEKNEVNRLQGTDKDDDLVGSTGRNSLNGWGGNDTLTGREGDDWLDGGHGDDILTGGGGADEFTFSSGHDVITDFSHSEGDTIHLAWIPDGQFTLDEFKLFTVITDPFGDTTIVMGAKGADVYKSIVGEYEGQSLEGILVAENFEVLA